VEGLTSKTQGGETLRVREVWRDNLDEEMDVIRGQFKNSGEYHYQTLRRAPAQRLSSSAAGVASPRLLSWSKPGEGSHLTQRLVILLGLVSDRAFRRRGGHLPVPRRCNVDMLKLIQLGLTFANAEGKLPLVSGELCVWQFNFRCAAPTAPGLACSPVHACERTRGGRRWALAAHRADTGGLCPAVRWTQWLAHTSRA